MVVLSPTLHALFARVFSLPTRTTHNDNKEPKRDETWVAAFLRTLHELRETCGVKAIFVADIDPQTRFPSKYDHQGAVSRFCLAFVHADAKRLDQNEPPFALDDLPIFEPKILDAIARTVRVWTPEISMTVKNALVYRFAFVSGCFYDALLETGYLTPLLPKQSYSKLHESNGRRSGKRKSLRVPTHSWPENTIHVSNHTTECWWCPWWWFSYVVRAI